MSIEVITAPTDLPVSLPFVKSHAKVDFEDDDDYLTAKIREAIEFIQAWTGRQLMPATLQLNLDGFPLGPIEPDVRPVRSMTSITYYDAAGVLQTLDAANYWVSLKRTLRIVPKRCWPITQCGRPDSVMVLFEAGYATADNVPERAKAAICLYVTLRYDIRTPIVVNQYAREVPQGLEALCEQLSIGGL